MSRNIDENVIEDDEALAAREQEISAQQKRNQETAAKKEAAISPLLAELGGDSPQNRAIAEGMQRQGISSTKDIGIRTVQQYTPGAEGNDATAGYEGYYTDVPEYYNKTTDQKINPERFGIIQNGQAGVKGGDIFFHLNADKNGNVNFQPQWSPRSHGFLRDNPVGKAIMAIGKIIPSPVQPFFVAAGAADALAHGKPLQALAAAIPYGLQEIASASNLAELAGNPDFVSTAKSAAGKIAEAAGAPSAYADAIGKAGVAALKTGITGGDVGKAVLSSGLGSLGGGDLLKSAGDFSKGIAGFDVGDTSEFSADALNDLNNQDLIDTRVDENGLGGFSFDTRADENGIGSPESSSTTLDTVTIRPKPGDYDEEDLYAPLELPPGAEPDETKPEEQYLLNPSEEPEKVLPTGPVPPIFPPKVPSTPPKPPSKPPQKPKADLSGLLSLLAVGTALNQPKIDAKFENFKSPTDLTGGYKFDWNAKPFDNPKDGVAYSQEYYGPHWNKPMAEGGITALPFAPTMNDGGVKAQEISHDDVTNQVIQHLRGGGHVMDDKTHSAVKYLASKGEPVHHIVGFMKHRMAAGGITSLGSYSDGGHLLKGPGDGMSDDIPATIADKQPARLANEEFVIPADVVSHLGNGSSESGAKVLYDMMAKVRKARTGNPKQGKQIDAHKFMPKV